MQLAATRAAIMINALYVDYPPFRGSKLGAPPIIAIGGSVSLDPVGATQYAIGRPAGVAASPLAEEPARERTLKRRFLAGDRLDSADLDVFALIVFSDHPALEDNRAVAIGLCRRYVLNVSATKAEPSAGVAVDDNALLIWPIDPDSGLDLSSLNERSRDNGNTNDVCTQAIDAYDMGAAGEALRLARKSDGAKMLGNSGPFLLAWAPGHHHASAVENAKILVADFTGIDEKRIGEIFSWWRDEIQEHPDLWTNGWDVRGIAYRLNELGDIIVTAGEETAEWLSE
jgi:hypothetical protein